MRFVALLFWLVAILAQPAWAETTPQLQSLEQRLAILAVNNPGEYGMAALDLASGEIVSFNGNKRFPMASTVKVAIAVTYLAQVDSGQRSLDDKAGGVTAAKLIELMITRSDNQATDLLLTMLGGPATVQHWLRAHDLEEMRIDRTIGQLLSARRNLKDIRDSSTPIAMLGLLRMIDTGEVLKPESRSLLLDTMSRCITGSNRIRGLLPSGTRVEHKTGTLAGYTGDVGFVTLPTGRRIAVALFARGGVNRPAVIATAARAIYDAFGGELGTEPVPAAQAYQQQGGR
jgi:beta-lactamase class A